MRDLPEGAVQTAVDVVARRQRAKKAREAVRADTEQFVVACRKAGIPVRDIAFLLDCSFQRVSQIEAQFLRGRGGG